jgi:hypothetical protein
LRVLFDVIGSVCVAAGIIGLAVQFARLSSSRGSKVSQVISASAGWPARQGLLTAAVGAWVLIGGWAAVSVPVAVIAWELTVQAVAMVRRGHRLWASRAS